MDQKAAEFVGAATRYPSMTLKVKENNQTSLLNWRQVPRSTSQQCIASRFLIPLDAMERSGCV